MLLKQSLSNNVDNESCIIKFPVYQIPYTKRSLVKMTENII